MTHFGGIANAGKSHVQSMCAIGAELKRLGHEFTLFGLESQVERAVQSGIPVHRLGSQDPDVGFAAAVRRNPDNVMGAALTYMKAMTAFLCEEAPKAFVDRKVEFVLADQEEPGAATAADLCGLPYVNVCSSLPLNEDLLLPPSFCGWSAKPNLVSRTRNYLAYRVRNIVVNQVSRIANGYRRRAGLKPYKRPDDSFSKLGQITQLVEEFDFPRTPHATNLTYVGPFQRGSLASPSFPCEELNGDPVVYASLGTSMSTRTDLLRMIAEACANLPVQLVVSLGGRDVTEEHRRFPGNPLIVSFAPQRELLGRAALAVTHAGLNTVMEALSFGVPMVAIPIAGDQLGNAARIRHFGVGQVVRPKEVNADILRTSIATVLEHPRYGAAAQRVKCAIDRTGGARQAAKIVAGLATSTVPNSSP